MKTAPHFIVGLTTFAALSAGIMLAAEDPALFDPKQAMLLVLADDAAGDANGGMVQVLNGQPNDAFTVSRPASPAVQSFRQ